MNARGVCPACGRTFETRVTNFIPSRFGRDFQCPLCKAWLVTDAKAKALFFVMTYGITLPLGVATLVLLNQSRLFELAFFQRQGWHWFGPTLLIVILGTIGLAGAWCGALASSKVTKLKRVQVALDRVGRH